MFAGVEHHCFELELARNWLNGADRKHGGGCEDGKDRNPGLQNNNILPLVAS